MVECRRRHVDTGRSYAAIVPAGCAHNLPSRRRAAFIGSVLADDGSNELGAPDPQPSLPRFLPPAITAVPVNNPPTFAVPPWLSAVQVSWIPPDPLPTLPRVLPASATAVRVDNPPIAAVQPWMVTVQVSWQPPDPAPWQKRPSRTVSVDNPPVRSGSWFTSISVGWIPPDPSPFVGGWQPLAPRQVNPSISAVRVDNPPIITAALGASLRASWEPPPPLPTLNARVVQPFLAPPTGMPTVLWPWLSSVLSTWTPPDPTPTLLRTLPPTITSVAVNNPPVVAVPRWMSTVQQSWQPPDPAPWQIPSRQRQSVDNPPFGGYVPTQPEYAPVVQAWQPPDPLPTLNIRIVQPFVSPPTGMPVTLWPWLASVVSAWTPPDPVPTLPRHLPAQLTAVRVDNPPGIAQWLSAVLGTWTPADTAQTLQRHVVPATTAAAARTPSVLSWLTTVLTAWGPPDPAPIQRRPSQTVSVDNPPRLSARWQPTVLQSWVPADPAPWLRPATQRQSVDRPPPIYSPWQPIILRSWAPADPAPQWYFPTQRQSVDRPPLASTPWLPVVLRSWEVPAPQPFQRVGYAASFILPPAVNPPPGGYPARVTMMREIAEAWQPPPPQPQAGFLPSWVLRAQFPPVPGRVFLLSPDVRAIIDTADVRAIELAPTTRAIMLSADIRAVVLPADVRCIVLPKDEAMATLPVMQWSPAAGADTDVYFLSLSRWLPAGDTVNTPSVTVVPISGDLSPLTAGAVTVDTGVRAVTIPPGVAFSDPGPRIQAVLSGGTTGKTYTTIVSWQDSQGRTINRPVLLLVAW